MSNTFKNFIKGDETPKLIALLTIRDSLWSIVGILEEWMELRFPKKIENNIKIFSKKKSSKKKSLKKEERVILQYNTTKLGGLSKSKSGNPVKVTDNIDLSNFVMIKELIKNLGGSPNFWLNMRKTNQIPYLKVGRRYYYHLDNIQKTIKVD
ncbi:hypothetical protein [Sphingobacterium endophyticum]|uniref:hypothetical protein n=1 Tax=Sphingobacterium endophyticum TaxID=2546448 RepID=UPI0018CC95B1|nr:hypothetical protein [Sphingobacterium endophyticum]